MRIALLLFFAWASYANAQSPKARAPIDLTGYWVSVVTSDWRWRMVTPPRGDYASIPITPEAKKVADAWDPAKDEAAGEQCKSYAAPALMRIPSRVRISWGDDNTLKIETDAGTQTRLFHFGDWKPATRAPGWQGESRGEWIVPQNRRGVGSGAAPLPPPAGAGTLKVITTNLRPGYLRKNGVPFSAQTRMTEYWDLNSGPAGEQWLTITTLVDDPVYLQEQWIVALHFKKEADGAKWDPSACSARW
jgi:hypothetical protein